jgi:hypothetical protein
MKPALIVVGADKGGVGKTTTSRLLLDYLASRSTPARAFDTEFPRGTLKRFHEDITDVVDLTQTSDQMRIIDTLQDAGQKVSVIDVRAGRLGPTLRVLRDIGFLDAARQGEFTFCLFHVLGRDLDDSPFRGRCTLFSREEPHQRDNLLRVGSGDFKLLLR